VKLSAVRTNERKTVPNVEGAAREPTSSVCRWRLC